MCKKAPGPRCVSVAKKQLATARKQLANAEKRGNEKQIEEKKAKLKEREEAYALTTEHIKEEAEKGNEAQAQKLRKKRDKLNKEAREQEAQAEVEPTEDKNEEVEPETAPEEPTQEAPVEKEKPKVSGTSSSFTAEEIQKLREKVANMTPEELKAEAKARRDKSTPKTDPSGATTYTNAQGEIHRTDGPAIIEKDGTQIWAKHGKFHRTDGPAIERADGSVEWRKNGETHREDGPARVSADGEREYYLNNKKLSDADVEKEPKLRDSENLARVKDTVSTDHTALNERGEAEVRSYVRNEGSLMDEEDRERVLNEAYEDHIRDNLDADASDAQVRQVRARFSDKGAVLNGAHDDEIGSLFSSDDDYDEDYDDLEAERRLADEEEGW